MTPMHKITGNYIQIDAPEELPEVLQNPPLDSFPGRSPGIQELVRLVPDQNRNDVASPNGKLRRARLLPHNQPRAHDAVQRIP